MGQDVGQPEPQALRGAGARPLPLCLPGPGDRAGVAGTHVAAARCQQRGRACGRS